MALTKCPECGREVSDAALQCPHCGKPFNKQVAKQVTNGYKVIYPLIFGVMAIIIGIGEFSSLHLGIGSPIKGVIFLVGGSLLVRWGWMNKKKYTK